MSQIRASQAKEIKRVECFVPPSLPFQAFFTPPRACSLLRRPASLQQKPKAAGSTKKGSRTFVKAFLVASRGRNVAPILIRTTAKQNGSPLTGLVLCRVTYRNSVQLPAATVTRHHERRTFIAFDQPPTHAVPVHNHYRPTVFFLLPPTPPLHDTRARGSMQRRRKAGVAAPRLRRGLK